MMPESFKLQCIRLRHQGLSLDEISSELGRSKSSVYYHIKSISLSEPRKIAIQALATERIVHCSRARKGKSFLGRSPIEFIEWTPEHVRMVAHFMFDGRVTAHSCIYYNRSKSLCQEMEKALESVFPFPPKKYVTPPDVTRLAYHSVELSTFIQKKIAVLLKQVWILDTECKRAFIQAFFDDEGCVSYDTLTRKRYVRGYQKQHSILEIIQRLLESFSVKSTIDYRGNAIIISKRIDIVRFFHEINFSKGVKVNGARSNSKWGESLEKREILNMLVNSYKGPRLNNQ